MTALASWCHRHRILIALLWAGALAGLGTAAIAAGTSYSDAVALPGADSTRAEQLLASALPSQSGDVASVVWHTASGSVRAPAVVGPMAATLTRIARLPGVSGVAGPYGGAGAPQISRDGRTAFATVQFADGGGQLSAAQARSLVETAGRARSATLEVEVGGSAIQQTEQTPASGSELVGVLAAAVVLFAALGSLLAAALPILTAIAGVGGGLLSVGLLSHAAPVAGFAPTLGALIGLGVGIDYALFIVTRFRCALRGGAPVGEAIAKAVDTSGRAVLFAGATVCVALLGMLVLGLAFLDGVAIAAVITVAFTVLASLTLLPALLGFLGPRVFGRRERLRIAAGEVSALTHGTEDKRGRWRRWAGSVERRPKAMSAVALLLMTVLAVPVLSLRLGTADSGNDPSATTTRKAYDLLAAGFGPGINGPLTLVAQTSSDTDRAAVGRLAAELAALPGVAGVTVDPPASGAVETVEVIPATAPQSARTSTLIATLRGRVIPRAEAGTALKVYVGGATAASADFSRVLGGKLPLFVLVVFALGFALLVLAFRSLLVPLTAAVMNLLAAAASFGAVTAFFAWGWGSQPLGMGPAGPVEAFLPVMMLAILFGLSMDYQVFLVSRMQEEWVHHRDNARAVKVGQVETSRVITAAATIMICVFCAFTFGSRRVIGEFGIGLATAVALDAFVLRTVLVPAVMHLFGAANWWLPGWLDRILPHLQAEAPAAPRPRREPAAIPGPRRARVDAP